MTTLLISSDYFTFHVATVKDSWPVKTNLSTSKILSTFSHVVSNFFIMHQMELQKRLLVHGHHFTSHLYFVSHTGSTLHLISTLVLLEMFPSEKNPLVIFNFVLESPYHLFYAQVVSTFISGYSINTFQKSSIRFLIVVVWCMNFNFQLFQIQLTEYFRSQNQTIQCKICCFTPNAITVSKAWFSYHCLPLLTIRSEFSFLLGLIFLWCLFCKCVKNIWRQKFENDDIFWKIWKK